MKDELGYALKDYLETLQYLGEDIVSSYLMDHGDKPSGESTCIINIADSPGKITKALRGQHVMAEVNGELILIFKIDDTVQGGRQIAETRNSKIGDLIITRFLENPRLNKTIPGNIVGESLRRESGIFYFVEDATRHYKSKISFTYKGRWIPPTDIELPPEPDPGDIF